MARQIYVNLPVKDLKRSTAFFTALGFNFEPKFTDDNAACMIVAENIFVMLLAENFFKTFTKKELCDAKKCTEVLVCLSCDSRAHVTDLVGKAAAAGGTIPGEPQDHGFMYGHAFEDLDGHIWELISMEPSAKGQG
ncbi:MAG TPA: VOC family protein [Candidatus Methylomirabilis sp.]|nr:VOC family protein [Candidatus Methylomirabilis sp.]HSB80976.1 VOC family protein [Candidatus Methylomirabilis sp.]